VVFISVKLEVGVDEHEENKKEPVIRASRKYSFIIKIPKKVSNNDIAVSI
jgi:hypothetical protein